MEGKYIKMRCLMCDKEMTFPKNTGDSRSCLYCGGHLIPIGFTDSKILDRSNKKKCKQMNESQIEDRPCIHCVEKMNLGCLECICIPYKPEVLLFKMGALIRETDIEEIESRLTNKIGIKCVILDARIGGVYTILNSKDI